MVDILISILIGLITGLISGMLSSWIVSKRIEAREQRRNLFEYWLQYAFNVYEECGMHIPIDMLNKLNEFGGLSGKLGQAVDTIENIRFPIPENRELTEEETKKIKNALVILEELGKLKKDDKR